MTRIDLDAAARWVNAAAGPAYESQFRNEMAPAHATLNSHSAITTAKVGTRVRDSNGHTALRVRGGWRYEASAAPGLLRDWQLLPYAPLRVLEVVVLPETAPPAPNKPMSVIGRLHWDNRHSSPWVSFQGITEYRQWARDVRKALPGTKTDYRYLDAHTPGGLLRIAQQRGDDK